MPRYFFHVYNDVDTQDDEGADLADDDAARKRAHREALALAADSIVSYAHLVLHHRIDVTDPEGRLVASIAFGDAIEIKE